MSINTVYIKNIDSPTQITNEAYTDVGSDNFQLGTVKRAFYDVEIWDGIDSNAVQLTENIDYTLEEIDANYTSEAGFNIYTAIDIINPTYQTGTIYITYKTIGSYTDISVLSSFNPVGVVQMYAGLTAPEYWLMCDGSAVSRETYAPLFLVIGTTYGIGDGSTTFNLPDIRGIFVRGAGTHGTLVDANGNPFAATLGTQQNDASHSHWHNMVREAGGAAQNRLDASADGNNTIVDDLINKNTARAPVTDGEHGIPRMDVETRPANIALNYIIKY